MAIDFNGYETQHEALGAIPPGSMVKVRMIIRQPNSPGSDPALSLSKKGDSEYLNCEFEVLSGSFVSKKIWSNFTIDGVTDGQKKAGAISRRFMCAALQAFRGISPKDASPAATEARRINQWLDLNGLEFGVVVDVEKPQAGDKYVNNTIKRIITVDDEVYRHIMAGGEVITTAPIPEIPQGTQSAAPGWAAPAKAPAAAPVAAPVAPAQGQLQANLSAPTAPSYAPPVQAAPQAPAAQPPRAPGGMPGWAAPAGGQLPPPTQFPTQASGMDDIPFG